jgi:hypothetical protein
LSDSACIECSSGRITPSNGLSSCTLCVPGKYAGGSGKTVCETCSPGTYNTVPGNICIGCTALTNCLVGYESRCIPDTGSQCVQCDDIYGCIYQRSACFVAGGTTVPDCLCKPGFELVSGKCSGCVSGKYKATGSSGLCTPITNPLICPQGQYLQLGTAFANSACVPCAPLPSNAVDGPAGCEWSCSAGFDNNAP